jgi:hypothetical protein
MLYITAQPTLWALIVIVAVPVGMVHLVRVGVTYIVEGARD